MLYFQLLTINYQLSTINYQLRTTTHYLQSTTYKKMLYKRSSALFDEAYQYIPGGVNSPVRAFKSVGGVPLFMKAAKGAYLTDADDHQYIDYINSWGPAILGHTHPEVLEARTGEFTPPGIY